MSNDDDNIIYMFDVEFPSGVAQIRYSLKQLTQMYFHISCAYRERDATLVVPVYSALATLNIILSQVSDSRALWRRAAELQWDIINNNEGDEALEEEMRHGS